jgi:SAM-dependent methyltransferase
MEKAFYGPDLAAIHHRFYSEFVQGAAPGVIALLRANGIKRGVVLDLGCGAGQLSARLLKAGYRTVGIDVSEAMIRIARRECPKGTFVCGSVVRAKLPQATGAVALGEVFNYLKSKQEMQQTFRNVFRALAPGGVLICDIKEPLPGKEKKFRSSARWERDWAIAVEVEEDPRANRLVRRIVTFRKCGRSWRTTEETHRQRIYRAEEVMEMLREAGFSCRTLVGFGRFKVSSDRKVLLALARVKSS